MNQPECVTGMKEDGIATSFMPTRNFTPITVFMMYGSRFLMNMLSAPEECFWKNLMAILMRIPKLLFYRAEDIVDFAWTAWPGYKVFTDQWNHVKITLLVPEERTDQVGRQFTAVKNALEFFTENVGPYPWPHLTFVDPPAKGSGAGGMEYTTLFTSQSSDRMPEWYSSARIRNSA